MDSTSSFLDLTGLARKRNNGSYVRNWPRPSPNGFNPFRGRTFGFSRSPDSPATG